MYIGLSCRFFHSSRNLRSTSSTTVSFEQIKRKSCNMNFRLALILCVCFAVYVSALSLESDRSKRDVMDSVKSAYTDAVKSVSDAGDSVAKAFKPTEKSVFDKMSDGIKG